MQHNNLNDQLITGSRAELLTNEENGAANEVTDLSETIRAPEIQELLSGNELRSQQFWSLVKFRAVITWRIPVIAIFRLGYYLIYLSLKNIFK